MLADFILAAACANGECPPATAQTQTVYSVAVTQSPAVPAPLISTYTIITPVGTNGLIFGRVHNGKFNGGKQLLRVLQQPSCKNCR